MPFAIRAPTTQKQIQNHKAFKSTIDCLVKCEWTDPTDRLKCDGSLLPFGHPFRFGALSLLLPPMYTICVDNDNRIDQLFSNNKPSIFLSFDIDFNFRVSVLKKRGKHIG